MPSSPSSLPSALVLLFAVACGLSVANVYYAQPQLDVLGAEFAIGQAGVGLLFGATQAGCALALLLVVPLGDLLERRRLMFVQLLLLVLSLLLVGFAGDTLGLALGLLGLGLLGTAMTQGLLAYAAALAAPGERGRVVGAAQGGVVIGLLLARSLAGLLADLGGWRSVYLVSAASMGGLGLLLWRVLPAAPSNELGLTYRQLLGSMFGLLASQRVLQVRGLLGLLMFAAFGVFWSSLVLLLGAPPHSLSHSAIGAFGLVGALGALGAARAGSLADRGHAQALSGGALLLLLLSWLPLALGAHSLAALILGVLLLDLAGQAIHVLNQSLVFAIDPRAHSRLVGCYMLFYAAGSGLGASAGTAMYAWAGWDAVSLLGAAISLAALAFWWFTRGVGGEARTAPEPASIEFAQALLDEAPLRLLARQGQRRAVGLAGLAAATETAAEVGTRRVRQVVIGQFTSRQQRIDHGQPDLDAIAHGQGHGAVEFDHRRWRQVQQRVVEGDDPCPVGVLGARRLGVHRDDGRLQGVGPETAAGQGSLDQAEPLDDQSAIP